MHTLYYPLAQCRCCGYPGVRVGPWVCYKHSGSLYIIIYAHVYPAAAPRAISPTARKYVSALYYPLVSQSQPLPHSYTYQRSTWSTCVYRLKYSHTLGLKCVRNLRAGGGLTARTCTCRHPACRRAARLSGQLVESSLLTSRTP